MDSRRTPLGDMGPPMRPLPKPKVLPKKAAVNVGRKASGKRPLVSNK